MFTGIVQDIGTVINIAVHAQSIQMSLATKLNSCHLSLGASVACNGCCLTIVSASEGQFSVDIGPETMLLTRFSKMKIGDRINLEPALRVGDSLGGHHVTGHVDGTFPIHSFEKTQDNFWKLIILFPNHYSKFMFIKGSLAISGISLTIANIYSHSEEYICAEFMIIPHTYKYTILQFISANFSEIEVEFDHSAKAIASLFEGMISNYSQIEKKSVQG